MELLDLLEAMTLFTSGTKLALIGGIIFIIISI